LVPTHGEGGHAPLPAPPSAGDPDPVGHPFAELPKVSAVLTEFQGHARTGPGCGHVTRAAIPAALRAHAFGPRLAGVLRSGFKTVQWLWAFVQSRKTSPGPRHGGRAWPLT